MIGDALVSKDLENKFNELSDLSIKLNNSFDDAVDGNTKIMKDINGLLKKCNKDKHRQIKKSDLSSEHSSGMYAMITSTGLGRSSYKYGQVDIFNYFIGGSSDASFRDFVLNHKDNYDFFYNNLKKSKKPLLKIIKKVSDKYPELKSLGHYDKEISISSSNEYIKKYYIQNGGIFLHSSNYSNFDISVGGEENENRYRRTTFRMNFGNIGIQPEQRIIAYILIDSNYDDFKNFYLNIKKEIDKQIDMWNNFMEDMKNELAAYLVFNKI